MHKKLVDIENLKAFREKLDDKYVIEGEYSPETTVGKSDFADNLTPYGDNSGIEDDSAFIFQTSGGESDIGASAQLKALYGASSEFNQLLNISRTTTTTNGVTFTISNGIISLSGTADADITFFLNQPLTLIGSHNYLLKGCPSGGSADTYSLVAYYIGSDTGNGNLKLSMGSTHNDCYAYIGIKSGTNTNGLVFKPQIFDLTLMGLDSITSVDQFNALFPLSYYAYNQGSIISTQVNGYKIVGYNAFDGEWVIGGINDSGVENANTYNAKSKNYIRVVPGQEYSYENTTFSANTSSSGMYVVEYDASKNFIKRNALGNFNGTNIIKKVTLTSDTYYVKLVLYIDSYNFTNNFPTSFAFHLTWDGSKTGYEPYNSITYTLPNVELRSVPDYVNGGQIRDILEPNGTLTRKVGYVDLSTLEWTNTSGASGTYWYSTSLALPNPTSVDTKPNLLASKYIADTWVHIYNNTNNNAIGITGNYLRVQNGSSTTEPSGILLYELATPTTEQNDDYKYTENTLIDDWGTQEFLSSQSIVLPQPCLFFYSVDYKAFIDSLGGRDDIDYVAENIVSQAQLDDVVNGDRPVALSLQTNNIKSDREIDDSESACPSIVFGPAGGTAEIQNGYQDFEELRGNSVAFNDILENGNFASTSGWNTNRATFTVSSNVAHITITDDSDWFAFYHSCYRINGHKYLCSFYGKASANQTITIGGWSQFSFNLTTTTQRYQKIYTSDTTGSFNFNFTQPSVPIGTQIDLSNVMFIDLTLMFGAGNEPTSVVEFNRLFPLPYYAYNQGTLISSQSNGLESIGMNQWDEEWEIGSINSDGTNGSSNDRIRSKNYIKVVQGTQYIVSLPSDYSYGNGFYIYYYDGNNTIIGTRLEIYNVSNITFTTPNNCEYIRFMCNSSYGTTYHNNIMIRLYYDTPNLPYEPYEKQTIALPNVELRSAGDVYDTLTPSGLLTRRVGVVDLGTLTYSRQQAYGVYEFYTTGISSLVKTGTTNIVSSMYLVGTRDALKNMDMAFASNGTTLFIRNDSYTDTATFKTAMSGVYLFYELATPTEEQTSDTFNNLVKVNNYGTLNFTSEQAIQVPQAYFIRYVVNLVEFLDTAYVKASGDANNLVVDSELSAYDVIDAQLKDAIGGTLRQCLCVKASLDFNNTKYIDLSTLSWTDMGSNTHVYWAQISDIKVSGGVLCSSLMTVPQVWSTLENNAISSHTSLQRVYAKLTDSITDATQFKNAMKGVLLAYEKA